uniref:Uncharacterized protein n=2 Tax=Oryza TaxID=4527 RepID=Q6Z0J5_ORYSJ|nr:hypothetical protein [Oryza sativa Japonica Group]
MRCQQTAASFSATSPFISDSNRVRCISPSSTVQHAASRSPELPPFPSPPPPNVISYPSFAPDVNSLL